MKYPFLVITPLFIAGILLQKYISLPIYFLPLMFLGVLAILIVYHFVRKNTSSKYPDYINLILFTLILFSGYFVSAFKWNSTSYYPEWFIKQKDVTIYGRVSSVGLMNRGGFTFQLNADSISFSNRTFHKKAKVLGRVKENSFSLYKNLSPGDYLSVTGLFYKGKDIRNPGDFDYNNYLRTEGVSGVINIYNSKDVQVISRSGNSFSRSLLLVRENIFNKLLHLHDAQTAALLKGLLLADRDDIDQETKTDFINSGVVHVLAVSGLHVGFILLVFLFMFGRFNLWIRSLLISIGIIFYILLTGAPASVVRAGIMSLILIISFLTNRDSSLLNGLAVSAFIILLFTPEQLYMAGFQLSYAAVLSIALIYPVLSKIEVITSIKNDFQRRLVYFILLSVSSQIGTLPFVMLYFGKISITSLPANILVIPLTGLILGNGIFTLLLSYIYYPLAHYPALSSGFMVSTLFYITKVSGGELSYVPVNHFSWVNLTAFYFFIGIFIFYFPRFTTIKTRIALILLLMANLFIYGSTGRSELFKDNEINIMALDVGQGDSFIIRFPDGTTALIDAGDAANLYDNGIRTVLPVMNYLGIQKIDYAFISHLDKDHFSGMLSLLQSGIIKKVYKPEGIPGDSINNKFEVYLKKRHILFSNYSKKALSVGKSRVYILNDYKFRNDNDNCGVIKVVYGEQSFLFTGDISKDAEYYYLSKYQHFLGSTVLKVSHHGSKTASSDEFIQYVHPYYSIISAGYKNSYNHPSTEALSNLAHYGAKILRTDLSGAIMLSSDGKHMKLVDWK